MTVPVYLYSAIKARMDLNTRDALRFVELLAQGTRLDERQHAQFAQLMGQIGADARALEICPHDKLLRYIAA